MMPRKLVLSLVTFLIVFAAAVPAKAAEPGTHGGRPSGPCDIYGEAGDPCVAAHSTTRALYRSYNGPLYQVVRQSDGKTLDIGVVQPSGGQAHDPGGYADAAAQDAFCKETYCWISKIYDQSAKHNDLTQAPRGGFSGPAMGGMNNLPIADMAPVSVMGHKVYGVFIEPGMGLRIDDPRGTAVDDQAQGQYWVINGRHFNSGCCFDYGNAEIDSRDDDNGTMETAYYGDSADWIHGTLPGPWIETDQENNLVGCIPAAGSHLCAHLPDIHWRFVTAMAKGEPHHWTSMGGDAQQGPLTVMFDGRRVNSSYDPMRKQGAILLGNGGDNSNSSQGTFYEGAVTAAGAFPSDATDQKVQANVVAAGYQEQPLVVTAASSKQPTGAQIFGLGQSRDLQVRYTNVTGAPVRSLAITLVAPPQWKAVVAGTGETSRTMPDALAPGASTSVTFTVSAGPGAFHGDLMAKALWADGIASGTHTETMPVKVRSSAPVKLNEFRIGSGANGNASDSFVELFNAGTDPVDLSNWTMTVRPTQQASFSSIHIPAGTTLRAKGFYLLGLSNSALAVPARAGESVIAVRSTAGMSVGDAVDVGTGTAVEHRKIATLGTAAADPTTLWQPLPDGPITLPPHATNVPVESAAGFKVGEKIALGYGATVPFVGAGHEQYEIATVTAVGKAGTQSYLADDAPAGATNLKVLSAADISVGDKIRLDIDSKGHGIETVQVTRVGTEGIKTNLAGDYPEGANRVRVRRAEGFHTGDQILIGTPATKEHVTVTAVTQQERGEAEIAFQPGLRKTHGRDEWVVLPGTGLDIAAPLRFNHAANLPFSDRGTGITFSPATRYPHLSDEPVQALGSGITLDRPLAKSHAIHAVLRDDKVTTAGYQGSPRPDQWFGGPEMVTRSLSFGRMVTVRQASMILRDASGQIVDTMNYGGLVDPWVAKGDQSESGMQSEGCFVPTPDFPYSRGGSAVDRSAGRFPDGAETGSDCTDFRVQAVTVLPIGAEAGSSSLKVASVAGFQPGENVTVGSAADAEHAVVAKVGTSGATATNRAANAGATTLFVHLPFGFDRGQIVTVGVGSSQEDATIAEIQRFDGFSITFTAPLRFAHPEGTPVAGSGIALTEALTRRHADGGQLTTEAPTPGSQNAYGSSAAAPKP